MNNQKETDVFGAETRSIERRDEILREKSSPVSEKDAQEIVGILENTLRVHGNGFGLSAPQIGIKKQVAVFRSKFFDFDLVNPTNVQLGSRLMTYKEEGCLSFPGVYRNTLRHATISFENGFEGESAVFSAKTPGKYTLQQMKMIVTGLQHEIDHFNGVLFMDKFAIKLTGSHKIGRNNPCFCGSNEKYKKCCAL